jgi:hypothetical protein
MIRWVVEIDHDNRKEGSDGGGVCQFHLDEMEVCITLGIQCATGYKKHFESPLSDRKVKERRLRDCAGIIGGKVASPSAGILHPPPSAYQNPSSPFSTSPTPRYCGTSSSYSTAPPLGRTPLKVFYAVL